MNTLTSSGAVKLYIGMILGGVWIALVVCKIPGADDLISLCKYGLTALVTHYLTYADPAADASKADGNTTITIPGGTPK